MSESKAVDTEKKVAREQDMEHGAHGVLDNDDGSSLGKGDILSREHTDPVLNAKMHLINIVSVAQLEWKTDIKKYEHEKDGTLLAQSNS